MTKRERPKGAKSVLWKGHHVMRMLAAFDKARHLRIYGYEFPDRSPTGDYAAADLPEGHPFWMATFQSAVVLLRQRLRELADELVAFEIEVPEQWLAEFVREDAEPHGGPSSIDWVAIHRKPDGMMVLRTVYGAPSAEVACASAGDSTDTPLVMVVRHDVCPTLEALGTLAEVGKVQQ